MTQILSQGDKFHGLGSTGNLPTAPQTAGQVARQNGPVARATQPFLGSTDARTKLRLVQGTGKIQFGAVCLSLFSLFAPVQPHRSGLGKDWGKGKSVDPARGF